MQLKPCLEGNLQVQTPVLEDLKSAKHSTSKKLEKKTKRRTKEIKINREESNSGKQKASKGGFLK